jgi:hypothetical protein
LTRVCGPIPAASLPAEPSPSPFQDAGAAIEYRSGRPCPPVGPSGEAAPGRTAPF